MKEGLMSHAQGKSDHTNFPSCWAYRAWKNSPALVVQLAGYAEHGLLYFLDPRNVDPLQLHPPQDMPTQTAALQDHPGNRILDNKNVAIFTSSEMLCKIAICMLILPAGLCPNRLWHRQRSPRLRFEAFLQIIFWSPQV